MIKCLCCQSEIVKKVIYSKKNCPVLNNVVYNTEKDALNCTLGNVELILCSKCNFVFNNDFNQKLILYDESYNNSRIFSYVYKDYLDKLVNICSKGIDERTKILEIGCGKGDFLRRICSATGAQGFGYDNTYEGEDKYGDNVNFFKGHFNPSKVNDKFDVLILRHVLEHVPKPYSFLKSICDRGILSQETKLWVEVPDFEWILNKGIFYDITYEHCNYFFKQTLINLLSSIGFKTISIRNVFEGQYILLEAIYALDGMSKKESSVSPLPIPRFIDKFYNNKRIYNDFIERVEKACIWGASGKGVTFLSELADEELKKIEYVIDINPQKQGRFLPVSAKRVEPPEVLKGVNNQFFVLVMNRVYEGEIEKKLEELGVNAQVSII